MSTNLVIVAIPEEMDRVWKISSEKVPHLTLLFLGEADTNPNIEQITQFVEHATTLSEHGPFYLEVDHRGTLGPDTADVIFFSERNRNLQWIKQFRGQLLQNHQIRSAYDSTEQYEEWEPHLTLGYPETPAKEPGDGFDHPLYSVCFDRIAVWIGDYEGPDFRLEWPEREFEGDMAIAYSDTKKAELLHYGIEHHGVKGMRWGQRKDRVTGAVKSGAKKLDKAVGKLDTHFGDRKFQQRANSTGTVHRLVNTAAKRTKEKDLAGINAKYEGKAKTSNTVHIQSLSRVPVQKQYREEVRKAYEKNLNDVASETTSKSGNLRYQVSPTLITKSKTATRWRVKAVKVQHAIAAAEIEFEVVPKFDADGFIIDFVIETVVPSDSATHGAVFVDGLLHGPGEKFVLEHFGIKGMRWGQRKAPPGAVTPTAMSRVPQGDKRKTKIDVGGGQNHPAHADAIKVAEAKVKLKKSGPSALSNQELRDVANRVQLENQVTLLTGNKGKQFTRRQLESVGSQTVQRGIAKGIAKSAAKKGGKTALLLA